MYHTCTLAATSCYAVPVIGAGIFFVEETLLAWLGSTLAHLLKQPRGTVLDDLDNWECIVNITKYGVYWKQSERRCLST